MPKFNHIHKYMRVKWGKKQTIVFRCMLPGCSHYVHEEMARNRKSLCWKCGQPFVMDVNAIRKEKPRCPNCVGTGRSEVKKVAEKPKTKEDVISNLDQLLADL